MYTAEGWTTRDKSRHHCCVYASQRPSSASVVWKWVPKAWTPSSHEWSSITISRGTRCAWQQRNGRIDRLGQRAEKVLIWNILYSDTIDARIYKRTLRELDLCRTALGDFEAILGDEIRRLEIDLLSQELSPEQQEQRIDQTAQALENRKLEEQRLEREAATLVAYGDYLLTHIQAARELNRWITGDDIYRYVSDYLRVHYPDANYVSSGQIHPFTNSPFRCMPSTTCPSLFVISGFRFPQS